MTARAGVIQTTQLGVEVTPGTAVAANRFIRSLSFALKPRRDVKEVKPNGSKYNQGTVPHKNWGEGTYDLALCYNAIIYVLSGIFPDPTPAQIGATAAYKRTYQTNVRSGDDTRKTYSLQDGDPTKVDVYPFAQFQSLDMQAGQDEVKCSGKFVTQKPTYNQTQTASPTQIDPRPVQRGQIDMFCDTVYANILTTKITDAKSEQFTLGDKFKETWSHNSTVSSFQDVAEVAPPVTFSFLTAHNSQSRAILDELDADALHYLGWRARGAVIADNSGTPVYEQITLKMAGKFGEPEPQKNYDGSIYAYKHNFILVDDPTNLGRPFEWEVINLLATL